ncbi:MAG TPA: hypothetical protein VH878_03550 [Thermodesulfobacteriota bacterium]
MSLIVTMLKKATPFLIFVFIYGCAATESDFSPFEPPEPLEEDMDPMSEFPEDTVRIYQDYQDYIIACVSDIRAI